MNKLRNKKGVFIRNKAVKPKYCLICGKEFVKKPEETYKYWETKKYCSIQCEHKSRIGKPTWASLNKEKASEMQKGEKGSNWRGGITSINRTIRNSLKYREWRLKVFKRDNFTCVNCGDDRGGNLNADHIKPFSLFPELRFELSNGRTLCELCHDKIGWSLFRENNPKKAL